jgi:hypothetical protein
MRLSYLLIVFIIHASITFYLLFENSINYTGFGSLILFPVKHILTIINIGFYGYLSYIPYLINSLLWSLAINYLLILVNNAVRDKFG